MINLKNIATSKLRAPRIVLYGPPGVWKTSTACAAPKPVVINIEDSLGKIKVPEIIKDDGDHIMRSYEDVMEALGALLSQEHDYKTVVIDTVDWFESLVWEKTCKRLGYASIEQPGYGKGYVEAAKEWDLFFEAINKLRAQKNLIVILTAHSAVTKFEDPLTAPYDSYGLKIHKRAAAKAEEWADVIGFCNFRTLTSKDKGDRTRATTTGEVILHLIGSPAFSAKNRLGRVSEVPLSWENLEKAMSG